jgi:probable HAF family extracellular repeat protein
MEALLFLPRVTWPQSIIATIPVAGPVAAAVNHVTNKVYVEAAGGVVVIDGATQTATTLQNTGPAGNYPNTIGVNEATNKIYVATLVDVLVIDGVTNAVTLVDPNAINLVGLVVNPVTNKIYVADDGIDGNTSPPTSHGCRIVVIDGATNATTTITDPNVGKASCPQIAVNTVTDKIYVANDPAASSVTVIDGTTNSTTTVPDSNIEFGTNIAVDPVTNMIYVTNTNAVMTIDGATNATAIVSEPGGAIALAVNTTTNRVYGPFWGECSPVARLGSYNSGCLGVLSAATNAVVAVSFPEQPTPNANNVAVDEATNTIYVASSLGWGPLAPSGGIAATTIIDGTTNSVKRVIDPNGASYWAYQDSIAVNAATNMIYWLHPARGTVTVIDGSATPATHTLGVIGAAGSVTSSPAGLNCGGGALSSCPQYSAGLPCSGHVYDQNDLCPQGAPTFAVGTVVHLSAAQQVPGYGITWYGACTGTGACNVTMNSDQWLDAEFQPVPTIVPNVVGLTLAAARQALTEAGFFEGTPNEQSSSTVPAGHLISQSPAAGTSVLGGSTIDVLLSTGAPANPGGGGSSGGGGGGGGNGSGGGGGMDSLTLAALLSALAMARRPRRREGRKRAASQWRAYTWALWGALGSLLPFAGATAQTYSVIDFPGSYAMEPIAISASGLTAGMDFDLAFLSNGATVTDIDPLRNTDNRGVGYALNAAGQVTGISYGIVNNGTHAFLYSSASRTETDLGTLPGGDSTYPSRINASGQITGYATVSGSSGSHAFLYDNGKLTDLGTLPGGTMSAGSAINDSGEVAGQADTAHGDLHAVITHGTSLTDIGTLAGGTTQTGYTSSANAINNAGQVAGTSSVLPSGSHAFLYSGGTLTDLGTLGGANTTGTLINEAGQVAGTSDVLPGGQHAFLYSGGTLTDLGTLGGASSIATDLNSSGQVVGSSDTATGPGVFLYTNGVMKDLNTLLDPADPLFGKAVLWNVRGINDSGWIIATGEILDPTEPTITSFLLVPLRFSPRSLAFLSQAVGSTGTPQPVTLTNTGTGPFALPMIAATNGFSQTNDCPAALPTGASCTIQVASSPVTAGYQSGALNITSGSATLVVKVNGAAFVPVVVKASATTVTAGAPVTVTWTSTSLATCLASGGAAGDGWAGNVSTSGKKSVTETAAGSYTYQVNCSLVGGQGYAYVMVVDTSAPPGTGGGGGGGNGGGGGGAIESLTLGALLSSLIARLRRARKTEIRGAFARAVA